MPSPLTNPFALGYAGPATVQGTISADRLLVELTGEAIEIGLVLLGLRAVEGTGASAHRLTSADWVDAFVRGFKSRGTVYLPRPVHTTRFIRSLADGGIFAGLIFMAGDDQSLSSRAADARICGVDPECTYLRSRWQPTHRVDARRRTDLSLLWSLTGPQFISHANTLPACMQLRRSAVRSHHSPPRRPPMTRSNRSGQIGGRVRCRFQTSGSSTLQQKCSTIKTMSCDERHMHQLKPSDSFR